MSLPQTAADVLNHHTTLEVESLDRIYLKVIQMRLQDPGGIAWFFRKHRGEAFATAKVMAEMTRPFEAAIEKFLETNAIPLIGFDRNQRKDDLLQAEDNRQRSLLHEKSTLLEQKISLVLQRANLIEQNDALLSEQSATIRKQEERLAAQQLEIKRLIQQAFGRRSERYLESPQQLKIDFGGGPEVTDAADGLQQAVDEKQLTDEAVAATAEVPSTRPAAPPKKKKKHDESLPANLPRIEKIIDAHDSDKTCATHGEKTLIGYDVRESLRMKSVKTMSWGLMTRA